MVYRYRHFKGGLYEYIMTARDSETAEPVVVYRSLKDDTVWVCPSQMFWGWVDVDAKSVRRFERIDPPMEES